MIRSIRRALVAAAALPLLALTAAPAQAAGAGVVVHNKFQTAYASWTLPSTVDAAGWTVTRDVFVDGTIDSAGVTVFGILGTTRTKCDADGTNCFYDASSEYFAGNPTTFSINKAGTAATLAGTFPTLYGTTSRQIAVSVSWTGVAGTPVTSDFTWKYRGFVEMSRSIDTYGEAATVVGSIDGVSAADAAYGHAEIDSGSRFTVSTNAVR